MCTDTWKKCPGSQPHRPHLRGWAEGPGRMHLSSWGGSAVVFCVTSFSSNSGFLYLWRTAWKSCIFPQRALNRVEEVCRALPTTTSPPPHRYTHTPTPTPTHIHTHFGLGGGVAEGESGYGKTLALLPNSKQQSLMKTVMCKLLIFIGPFGEYSCLSGNERECLCL